MDLDLFVIITVPKSPPAEKKIAENEQWLENLKYAIFHKKIILYIKYLLAYFTIKSKETNPLSLYFLASKYLNDAGN